MPLTRTFALASTLFAGVVHAQRVTVDPDVRVTYDSRVPHMEAYIAAASAHPDLLFAGGVLLPLGRAWSLAETRIWVSRTAGATWRPTLLPAEIEGGWDNAIAAGPGDSLYFLTA